MAVKDMLAEARGHSTMTRVMEPPIKPVLDYILLYRPDIDMSDGGIQLLPGHDRLTGPKVAEVISVGPGRPSEWNAEIIPRTGTIIDGVEGRKLIQEIAPGDTVLYHGGAGTEWEHDGTVYLWILPGDLIGVMT